MAYERVTGMLGGERLDLLTAMLAAVTVNVNKGKKGGTVKVRDFLPEWDQRPQSWGDQLTIAQALAGSGWGTITSGTEG